MDPQCMQIDGVFDDRLPRPCDRHIMDFNAVGAASSINSLCYLFLNLNGRGEVGVDGVIAFRQRIQHTDRCAGGLSAMDLL